MKTRTETVIEGSDWDKLVMETYGRPYCFQQQEGCRDRGVFRFSVPDSETGDQGTHDSIPEIVNHETRGVKFEVWLKRSPKEHLKGEESGQYQGIIDMWWERNFYPDFQTLANDLYAKGLLKAGDYTIDIDW